MKNNKNSKNQKKINTKNYYNLEQIKFVINFFQIYLSSFKI